MILITGGTGLVGAHLLLHLAEGGRALRALYRGEGSIAKTKNLFTYYNRLPLFERIEWVQGDVTDVPSIEIAFAGIDHVYHCAALVSFDSKDEEQLRKTNIEGTANMVNLSLAHSVKKFCYVSSIAALGDLRQGETVITEETEWNPEKTHSDYALTKHGGEMEVWRAYQEGLDVVIVNPGVIFGYGFWDNGSGGVLKNIKNGMYFYTKGLTGIVAIGDVIKIMTVLMDGPITGERFILVARNMDFETMLNILSQSMKKQHPFIHASPIMTGVAWRIDWFLSKLLLRKRLFTKAIARASHSREVYDNKKIVNALNYKFADMQPYLKKLAEDYTALKL